MIAPAFSTPSAPSDDVQQHDACGTGYIVVPKDKDPGGRKALDYAIDLLVKNDHRIGRTPAKIEEEFIVEKGAKKLRIKEGTDIDIGDGAGIVTAIPFEILKKEIPALNAKRLEPGQYGVARIYLPADATERSKAEKIINETLSESKFGFAEIGRRAVKGNLDILSNKIREDHAHIIDIAFDRPTGLTDDKDFRKKMYDCHMAIERKLEKSGLSRSCHVGAINDRITVYKGVFTARQIGQFFDDFNDKDFKTGFAFYHGRYATNAGTRISNVHPFIYGGTAAAHNGEIVTIAGNRARLKRDIEAHSGEEFITPAGTTDSRTLAAAYANLRHRGIDAAEAMKRLISTAGWRQDVRLNEKTTNLLEHFSLGSAPYAGPAYLGYIDALEGDITLNSIMDFGGLRPCTIMTLDDGTIISGSENALPDGVMESREKAEIVKQGRQANRMLNMNDPIHYVNAMRSLKPLEQVQFNTMTGAERSNEDILKEMIAKNQVETDALQARLKKYTVRTREYDGFTHPLDYNGFSGTKRQFALGHDDQTYTYFSTGMALTGKQAVGAMGGVTPAWYLTNIPTSLFRAAKSAFSIVTAPPHDAKREGYLMDMSTTLGNIKDKHSNLIKLSSVILPPGALRTVKKDPNDLGTLELQMRKEGVKSHELNCTFLLQENREEGFKEFKKRLHDLAEEAEAQVRAGTDVLVLSDGLVDGKHQAIDGMLIAAYIHKHLSEKTVSDTDKTSLRDKVSLVFNAGCVRNEHDAFMLLTNGMDAVYPSMHYANVVAAYEAHEIKGKGQKEQTILKTDALENALKAMHDGVVNAMSRCGIPSISAVRDAQMFTFEGVRINQAEEPELWKAFGGHASVYSPLGIFGLRKIYNNAVDLHKFTSERVNGTVLPNAMEYLQQKSRRTPLLGGDETSVYAEPVSPKFFNDQMRKWRQSFTAKEHMSADAVKVLMEAGANVDQTLTLNNLAAAVNDPTKMASINKALAATRDALIAEYGSARNADDFVTAMNALTIGEVASYAQWKASYENGSMRVLLPAELLQADEATLDPTARAHRNRLIRDLTKDGTTTEEFLKKRPKHPADYSELKKLTANDINNYKMDTADRVAFAAMEEHERLNPRGVVDMLFLKKEVIGKESTPTVKASDIAKRIYIASMSVGALTPLANRELSNVANSLGIHKETGEGGMPPVDQNLGVRTSDDAQDTIIQIGSARFGVDIDFIISPDRWVNGKFTPGRVTIKMAQGAKPGEGGQLPGEKVTELIAGLRHAFPGVDLPSPAPHHDIYSIEDLFQLVRDCKRTAIKGVEREVGVKIASSGADVFAVGLGVAKMGVDSITFAAGDGGTGAGPLTSIQHTGRGMEDAIILARKLDEAGFGNGPKRYYEGGIKTPLDFVRAVAAGYDHVGFGTAAAIAEGCKWLQMCNKSGACTPGVANNEIAFDGDPKATQKYFLAFMHGVQEILSKMKVDGHAVTSIDQIRGRTDLLEVLVPKNITPDPDAKEEMRKRGNASDLHALLLNKATKAEDLASKPDVELRDLAKKYGIANAETLLKDELIPAILTETRKIALPEVPDPNWKRPPDPKEQTNYVLEDALVDKVVDLASGKQIDSTTGKPFSKSLNIDYKGKDTFISIDSPIESTQFIGPRMAAFVAAVNGYLKTNPGLSIKEVVKRLNVRGADVQLPALSSWKSSVGGDAPRLEVNLKLDGHGAQSFGAFTGEGINYDVTGALQYGAFKMTSGGNHVIRSPLGRGGMAAGNSFGYGARGGSFAIEGNLGPRAGVRNAGASYVVDGDVGDNAFTFMSRGSVVVLGDPGYNFGAGSSAGVMAVYHNKDKDKKKDKKLLEDRCHKDSVVVSEANKEYQAKIKEMLKKYCAAIRLSKNGADSPPSRAQMILNDWENQKQHFYIITPKYLEKALQALDSPSKAEEAEQLRQAIRQVYSRQDGTGPNPIFSGLEQVWAEKYRIVEPPVGVAV